MARRSHLVSTLVLACVFFFSISYLYSGPGSITARDAARMIASVRPGAQTALKDGSRKPGFTPDLSKLPGDLLKGGSIAPKLENATMKAELGRVAWKFLHTTAARYPKHPTATDRETFGFFFFLIPRVYPCGDCAQHFGELLQQMPPQTSSRDALMGWLCEAHNAVNTRLNKTIFDCSKIGDSYDCGCGEKDDEDEDNKDKKGKKGGKEAGDGEEGEEEYEDKLVKQE